LIRKENPHGVDLNEDVIVQWYGASHKDVVIASVNFDEETPVISPFSDQIKLNLSQSSLLQIAQEKTRKESLEKVHAHLTSKLGNIWRSMV